MVSSVATVILSEICSFIRERFSLGTKSAKILVRLGYLVINLEVLLCLLKEIKYYSHVSYHFCNTIYEFLKYLSYFLFNFSFFSVLFVALFSLSLPSSSFPLSN